MKENRVEEAAKLFTKGYNCAQSVFAAYADMFGMEQEDALKMTSTMGAGIGRMREVCGAVSAMALLLGMQQGNADASDRDKKEQVYALTRKLADRFREENGSIICRELLGMKNREESARPSERTQKYYETRPCLGFVASAAAIIEEELFKDNENGKKVF